MRSRSRPTSTPDQRRRDQSEVRERRIAAADARHAEKHLTEPLALGDLLEWRVGIGDGDEVAARVRARQRSRFTRSRKYWNRMLGSSVVPDLLDTMNSVCARSTAASVAGDLRGIGGVQHDAVRESP